MLARCAQSVSMPPALFALSLAAFSIGTAEFIIAGILPDLSSDLAVSIPTAGLLVTFYAVAVAIGGPILAIFTARLPKKPMIVVLLSIFVLGQAFCALAPNYPLLVASRVFVACGHGLFYGIAGVLATELVPLERRGAALSLLLGGITVANVLGVPGGTAIGNALGWRASFWAVGAVALPATVLVALLLPPGKARNEHSATVRDEIAVLGQQQVYLSFLVIGLVMVGALAFATYQVPVLLQVTGVALVNTPIYLVIGGVGSIAGIYAGGRLADWKLMPSMIAILLLQAVLYGTLLVAQHAFLPMAINMFLTGAVGFAFTSPVQSRVLTAARRAPNLASTLVSSAYNIGIALGAWVGAAWIDRGFGYDRLPLIAIVCSLAAAAVAALSWTLERRQSTLAMA
jgi:DHA1 family inner membrane transport protein